jgi:hypothetical protein
MDIIKGFYAGDLGLSMVVVHRFQMHLKSKKGNFGRTEVCLTSKNIDF